MVKKVKVKEKVYTYSGYELEGKVVDVITMLQSLVTKLGPDVLIDYEQSQHYDDYEFNVYIEREETSVKKESLGKKQRRFTLMIATLIAWAYEEGYELTFGDAFRDQRVTYGHEKSLHRSRLAVDLNLFKNGRYLVKTSDHEPLGLFWESIGGTWGGRFDDGNHYSIEHGGMK